MSFSPMQKKLTDLLCAEVEQAKGLLQTLHDEFVSIQNRDLDILHDVLNKKLSYTTKLGQIETEINSNIRQLVEKPQTDTVQQYLASFAKLSSGNSKLVSDLKSIAHECKTQNEINGRLVNSANNSIKQALAIISGQDQSYAGYNADGKNEDNNSQNSISIV